MQKTVYKASRKKSENKSLSELVLFLKAFIVYTVVYAVVCISAFYLDIDNGLLVPVSLCTFCLSGFLSGFVIGRMKRKNGLINGIIYSLPTIALFLFISILINSFRIDLTLLISVLCVLVFSGLGGVISVNVRKKTKIKK